MPDFGDDKLYSGQLADDKQNINEYKLLGSDSLLLPNIYVHHKLLINSTKHVIKKFFLFLVVEIVYTIPHFYSCIG